jgi:NAD(P)-dependent dehydrogenase (short-subunit alcohol dehydrogenase family)
MENKQQVWFVTGASKGLGLALVKQLLNLGHKVAATSRDAGALQKAVGITTAAFMPLAVDLTNEASVDAALTQTVNHFGRLDVLVNNAGYGLQGGIEEIADAEARENFNVNVFGALNVIRKALPHFRQQHAGHIFNISSIGGFTGAFPGWGIYCATKFAMEGFSESLSAELKPFNIKVTLVEPGYFRTSFLSEDSMVLAAQRMAIYENVRESQQLHQQVLNGNQAGDPEKAVAALIKVAAAPQAPLHLFLGKDAYAMAEGKIKDIQRDLETWKEVTLSTDFDAVAV